MSRKKKDKLRIAMLGHKRIPSREGGIEIVVSELAVRMAELGHKVTCYNRKGSHAGSEDKKLSEYKGIRIKRVFTIKKGGLAAVSASLFASIRVAFSRYDVAHFHAEGPCAILWLPKLFGKKCIATIHGLDHQRVKWGKFASWYIRFGEKCAVRFADEIIVLSENAKRYFTEKYNRKTVFIPNGVTRPKIIEADEITKRYGLRTDDYILFLGRLVPEKGLEYLVKAYKQVKTDKRLFIVGGPSNTEKFEKSLIDLADDDPRISFTGFVQGKRLEEFYSNAYVYVLPSDLEGMPLSLLEAMSYGNCCLTSDIPECSAVTQDCGVTFAKGDISDLTDKLQYLCDNPEKVRSYKEKSADFICEKYNWDDIVERTLQLYT